MSGDTARYPTSGDAMILSVRIASLCLCLAFLAPAARAADPSELPDGTDIKGAADHPLIQRFDGSSIRYYQKKAFDEMVIGLSSAQADKPKTTTAEGPRTTLVYVMPKDVSTLEALRGYQNELAKLGKVTVLFKGVYSEGREELDNGINQFMNMVYGDVAGASSWMRWNPEYRYSAFKVALPEGNLYLSIYAGLNTGNGSADFSTVPKGRVGVRLDIVEPKAMASRMVTVESAEMAAEIKKNGSVSLYGILFDTGKADLKPDSVQALQEIGKLMASDAKLKLLVVGHTDNVGGFESNRELSQRRAKSVVAALVAEQKVAAARLQSFGASYAAPVASNAAEAGRAKNRRVELVSF
ncbi:MAG: OmpA family protein [Thermomonas sp.]